MIELVATYANKADHTIRSVVWYDNFLGVHYVDTYNGDDEKTAEYADFFLASRAARDHVNNG
jgi:hypothetical protein